MSLAEPLAELSKRFRVPGASLAYWHDGHLREEATGVLNLDTGVEVTTDSLFQIGSITKVWTATQLMLLAERGEITLDTPVDGFPGVTIKHLLTHTSGIDGDFFHDTGRGDDCLARYAEDARQVARVHPPGAAHSYCNTGFSLAGRVIETITGKVWDAALREQIIEPLGLTHTWTLPEDVLRFRAATGHLGEPGEEPGPTPRWGMMRTVGPAGLICSTAADVVRFARSFHDGALLTPASAELMVTPHVELPANPYGTHWGLGWILDTWEGRAVWSHGGNTIGQSAQLWTLPGTGTGNDSGTTVCVLANGGDTYGFFQAVAQELFPALCGVRPRPLPQPPGEVVPVDGRHDGVYERESARITVEGARMTYLNTSAFADLDEPMLFDLVALDDDRYLARREGTATWVGVTFATREDGTPYQYFSLRSTPRLP
ncbi:hypothetical protein GCM10022248_66440 [Nonomuraea soli]